MNQKKKNDTLKRSMEEAMEKAKEAEYQSLADGLNTENTLSQDYTYIYYWWVHLRDWPGDFGNFVGCWDDKAGSNHCHFSNYHFLWISFDGTWRL